MSNGLRPASISYSNTPSAHQSTEKPAKQGHTHITVVIFNTFSSQTLPSPRTVVLSAQYFRSDVVGCTAERGRRVARSDALLAHAVIGQLDVALVVEQHVVQLQIAVDDALLVQEVERETDLGRVEAGVLLGQAALPLHVKHQISTTHKLNHEEQPAK